MSAVPVLELQKMNCAYARKQVVFDIDLTVGRGEIVSLFGHNGAGKTTVIKNVLGAYKPAGGSVHYEGADITGSSPRSNVKRGMALIPSERFVFKDLTVHDNLLLGAANLDSDQRQAELLAQVYELFPILQERSKQLAGTMSGGQQRMVSLGLALMTEPRLLLLDEPSLGLAPAVVQHIFTAVRELADTGLSVLLLEQNVGQALRISDRAYVMRSGRIILEETAEQMRSRESYWDLLRPRMVNDELVQLARRCSDLLRQHGQTVSVAEGSAGGLISASLLSVPGASAYYVGGAVVYTFAASKAFMAGPIEVPPGMRGATEAFAVYLAQSVAAKLESTWGIGEAGAAGPPNRYGDPAGHAWVAVSGPSPRSRHLQTDSDDRSHNMVAFAAAAMTLLIDAITNS